ncbi:MAG TPA: hypothetical protein VNM14_23220 [Planctomycetota bacterium]|nr:hypothetical protein [Planctomycetota bacterium]
MRIVIAVVLALALADDAELVRPLEAKGAKVKKAPNGSVTEISVGGIKGITLEDYKTVGQCKNLLVLNLSAEELRFNDEAAAQLTGLERLERFFSNGAQLSDDGFKSLASWKSLKQIGFDHWFRTKKDQPIGAGLAHLAALPNLETVRLGGCMIGIEAMEALATIKTLKKLDVFHTFYVNDDALLPLQKLPALRIFIAGSQFQPRISDAALKNLSGVKSLEEISLTETWLTYEGGFKHLAALPNLKKLSLPKVVASEEDIQRLKKELPNLVVEWTLPDEATVEKTKATFNRHFEKQKK